MATIQLTHIFWLTLTTWSELKWKTCWECNALASPLYYLMGRCQNLLLPPWVQSVWNTTQSRSILRSHLSSDWLMLWTTTKLWLVCPGVAWPHVTLMTRRAEPSMYGPSWAPHGAMPCVPHVMDCWEQLLLEMTFLIGGFRRGLWLTLSTA